MLPRQSCFIAYLFIHLLIILLVGQAPAYADGPLGTVVAARSLDDIRAEVTAKLDLDNPRIADTAMTMAADYPGEYSINQVSQIYNGMTQSGWYYFNDPTGSESYQNSNQSFKGARSRTPSAWGIAMTLPS